MTGLEQRSDTISLLFYSDHSGCHVRNRLKGQRQKEIIIIQTREAVKVMRNWWDPAYILNPTGSAHRSDVGCEKVSYQGFGQGTWKDRVAIT